MLEFEFRYPNVTLGGRKFDTKVYIATGTAKDGMYTISLALNRQLSLDLGGMQNHDGLALEIEDIHTKSVIKDKVKIIKINAPSDDGPGDLTLKSLMMKK